MSKDSDKVKRWRQACRKRIFESMGGRCVVCGYDKCMEAMAFHHLEPSKKEFSISWAISNSQNWETIVKELRKCVLLCHNCHCELHADFIKIPENAFQFNESYADYKSLNKKDFNIAIVPEQNIRKKKREILTPCLICSTLKTSIQKYCSPACAKAATLRLDWSNIDLLTELRYKTAVKLSKELEVSDKTISKRIKKLMQAPLNNDPCKLGEYLRIKFFKIISDKIGGFNSFKLLSKCKEIDKKTGLNNIKIPGFWRVFYKNINNQNVIMKYCKDVGDGGMSLIFVFEDGRSIINYTPQFENSWAILE